MASADWTGAIYELSACRRYGEQQNLRYSIEIYFTLDRSKVDFFFFFCLCSLSTLKSAEGDTD